MSIKDKISELDSVNDNLVEVPISVIVLDENDNAPIFQNVSIELLLFVFKISYQFALMASLNVTTL